MDNVGLGVVAQQLAKDNAHQVIPGRQKEHGRVRVVAEAPSQFAQAPDHARKNRVEKDGPVAVGGDTRDVAVQVVAVQEAEAKRMLGQAHRGRGQSQPLSRDDLPHGSGRGVAGEQEKLGLLCAVGIGFTTQQAAGYRAVGAT